MAVLLNDGRGLNLSSISATSAYQNRCDNMHNKKVYNLGVVNAKDSSASQIVHAYIQHIESTIRKTLCTTGKHGYYGHHQMASDNSTLTAEVT